MSSKELYSIREWAPCNLESIPLYVNRGFFSVEVKLTCVDAIEEFLAFGSDVGIVFWYNRQTGEMQKLRAETISRITCVKIVDSVEYMVAAGSACGQVSVFQIQKPLPADLNLVAPCTRSKPIERYTIRDLHQTPVMCCEWSKNGMKLYSGDRQGIVVLTEFDYQTHLSKSIEILCEAYEIVQLSVHQCFLLVSTLYRAIICQRNLNSGQWHIKQIGKTDRKQLVDCGGIFLKRNTKDPLLITGRPGLRFWIADTEGNVEKTLLFRDAIAHSPTWEIPILNPKCPMNPLETNKTKKNEQIIPGETNFRNFYLYAGQDTLIVTHDEIGLYILNLDRLRVEAVARGFRKILDFCVCGKEIFILEGERSLLRLAPLPEKPNKTAKIIFNPLLPPPVPVLGAAAANHFESPVEYEPEEQSIVNAEECFELPPIETLNLNIPIELAVESPRAEQNRRLQIFNEISQLDFDQSILHRSGLLLNGRKKRKSKSSERPKEVTGIVEIGQVAKTNDDSPNSLAATKSQTTHPTLMDASFCVDTAEGQTRETIKAEKFEELLGHISPHLELPHISPISPIAPEELNILQISPVSPIRVEELERLQGSKNITEQIQNLKSPTIELKYPKSSHEDAGVQTTPRKQNYYISEDSNVCDYSTGDPVDDICQALRASVLIADTETDSAAPSTPLRQEQQSSGQQHNLQFVTSPPPLEEIHSFMPDFRRIRDPLRKSPPPSGNSSTSSEWEFLDN